MNTESKPKKELKHIVSFLFIAMLICLMTGKTRAYVMPVEQLVDLMTRNYSKFKTLVITQSTHLITPEDLEVQMVLEEKIWLKSPGFHHSEMMGQPDGWDSVANELMAKRPIKKHWFETSIQFKKPQLPESRRQPKSQEGQLDLFDDQPKLEEQTDNDEPIEPSPSEFTLL